MHAANPNLDTARRYIAALEAGVTGDALAAFFTPDVVITELPNRFRPTGGRSELPAILEAAERGQRVMRRQRYEILSIVGDGDRVALELDWTGVLAVPVGTLQPGAEMRDHVAVFLEYRDGLIAAQRHYDCYEAF